jgi:esterase/lipase superfamily enzyme
MDDKQSKKKYKNRDILDYQILSEPGEYGYAKVLDLLLKEKGLKDSPITKDNLGGSQRMFYELYHSMVKADKKAKDVLLFIHGYAYTFDEELKAILDLKKMFVDNKNTPIENILFVSWPASSTVFPLTYFDDKLMSINSGHSLMRLFYLYTQFLKEIFSNKDLKPCNQKIHLIAHSMGNRVLQSMLYSLKSENITRVIDQVLLLNSDVSQRVFEESEDSFCKLPLLANRISIYINRKDLILNISQFSKNILSPRLGKSGPTNFDKLKSVVSVIDCTHAKNDLNSSLKMELGEHWGYLSSSAVQKDIFENLMGVDKNLIADRNKIDDSTFEIMG